MRPPIDWSAASSTVGVGRRGAHAGVDLVVAPHAFHEPFVGRRVDLGGIEAGRQASQAVVGELVQQHSSIAVMPPIMKPIRIGPVWARSTAGAATSALVPTIPRTHLVGEQPSRSLRSGSVRPVARISARFSRCCRAVGQRPSDRLAINKCHMAYRNGLVAECVGAGAGPVRDVAAFPAPADGPSRCDVRQPPWLPPSLCGGRRRVYNAIDTLPPAAIRRP